MILSPLLHRAYLDHSSTESLSLPPTTTLHQKKAHAISVNLSFYLLP